MPAEYRLDVPHRIVHSRAWGSLTDADLLDHQRRLKADPAFDPGFDQLFDFSQVDDAAQVTSAGIRSLARGNAFGAGSRRAFLVESELVYGIMRMFQAHTSNDPDELLVVLRSRADAVTWLMRRDPDQTSA